jgi:hypothetical protein
MRCYRRSENVVVEAIIVPELELRNVKMQVFPPDVVECADDAALDDAPKTLNRIKFGYIVVARSKATKQSIFSLRGEMDCFAFARNNPVRVSVASKSRPPRR